MSSASRRRHRKKYNKAPIIDLTDRKWEPPNTWKRSVPIDRPEHEGACGIIVFRDYSCREVLLVSKSREYGFPEGSSKKGETNEETAARKLEELGLKRTDVVRVGHKYIDWKDCKSNVVRYFIGMARDIQLSLHCDLEEGLEIGWEFIERAFLKLEKSELDGVLQEADFYMNPEKYSPDSD